MEILDLKSKINEMKTSSHNSTGDVSWKERIQLYWRSINTIYTIWRRENGKNWTEPKRNIMNHEVTQSCPILWDPMDWSPPGDFPGKNTGVDYHFLLQGIFPTQESNPGLPHCRQMLYHLSHQGSLMRETWNTINVSMHT